MTQHQMFYGRSAQDRLLSSDDILEVGRRFGQRVDVQPVRRIALDTPLSRGRIIAHDPWPGLYFGGYDVEYLQDNEMTVEEPPALFCGVLLSGQSSVARLGDHARVTVRVGEPLVLGFRETVRCASTHRAGEHCAGIGLRIEMAFFDSAAPSGLKAALEPFRRRLEDPDPIEVLPASPRLIALADAALNSDLEGPTQVLFLEGLLLSFLAELCHLLDRADREPSRSGLSPREWRRVMLVADHLRTSLDQTPSLSELARMAGINATTLGRQFQAVYGESIFAWFRNRRLEHARGLLRAGEGSVTDICFRVGFTSPAAFATAYRRRYGHPPSLEAVRSA